MKLTPKVQNKKTIHTSRTMMFAELEKVMDYSTENDNYLEALDNNVTAKQSSSGVNKTATFLKQLYGFDINNPQFLAFKYFWKITEHNEKPLIALIYAVYEDYLLAESIDVVQAVKIGDKASKELFEGNIERYHPNRFSVVTRTSIARRLASSWKQAGFIEGKVKNIRIQPEINYRVACFAFLLAYLNSERGDFIWHSIGVKALCLNESRLRELAVESSMKDHMQYQYSGDVTSISFNNLLNKIGINAI